MGDGWRRIQGGAFEPLLIEGLRFHDRRIAQLEEENRGLRDTDMSLRRELAELREAQDQLRADVAALTAALPDHGHSKASGRAPCRRGRRRRRSHHVSYRFLDSHNTRRRAKKE